MAIILGMATVPASSTVAAFMIPSGTANTVIYQVTNPQVVYIGQSVTLSSANGMIVPNTPFQSESYVTTKGITVYATTGNATASSFSYIINTGEL